MRYDLIDLRLFVNVIDAGSISAGAERSHLAIASASARIRGMEDALGVPLLARSARGVRPTPAGLTLLRHATGVLQQMERLRGDLAEFSHGLKGQVRLLSNTAALSDFLPATLARFLAARPNVSVELIERPSPLIVEALAGDLADIGIITDTVPHPGLQTYALRDDPLVVIGGRSQALADRPSVTISDLAGQPFVGLNGDTALHAYIDHHAAQSGVRLAYRVRLPGLADVCQLAASGVALAIVPQRIAQRLGRGAPMARIPLAEAWARRKLLLAVRELAALPGFAAELVQQILDDVTQSPGSRRREPLPVPSRGSPP